MTYLERKMPADVPLHRGVVGAMGLNSLPDMWRPYVYRGSNPPEDVEVKPKPKPKRKRKRRPKPKPDNAAVLRARQVRREEMSRRMAERQAQPAPEPPRIDISDESTWLAPVIPLFPETPDPFEPARASRKVTRLPRSLRPSPGWKPMTGADLEAILDELDDD